MTKKTSRLLFLIIASITATIGIVLMIVASVRTSKVGKKDFSHDLVAQSITLNMEQSDTDIRVLCHDIIINGEIRNDSKFDYALVTVEIIFAGVKNDTGEYKEFLYTKEVENFYSGADISFNDEKISVISTDGYIPEYIKEVKLIVDGATKEIAYEKIDDLNLILFAASLSFVFVGGVLFIKWNNLRKKSQQQEKTLTKEDI